MRAFSEVLALGALFASLAALSWRKWPDVLLDFGRELYTPWQLAQGAVLYRDVASFFGPFLNTSTPRCSEWRGRRTPR